MGEHISCFGLTKPGPGSDVGGITRSAQKEGDHYVLSGEKMWITLSHLADRMLVFAKTDPDIGTRGYIMGLWAICLTMFRRWLTRLKDDCG